MEGLKLVMGDLRIERYEESVREYLEIEYWSKEEVNIRTRYGDDEADCRINKEEAKQIVEHLTKVFEL